MPPFPCASAFQEAVGGLSHDDKTLMYVVILPSTVPSHQHLLHLLSSVSFCLWGGGAEHRRGNTLRIVSANSLVSQKPTFLIERPAQHLPTWKCTSPPWPGKGGRSVALLPKALGTSFPLVKAGQSINGHAPDVCLIKSTCTHRASATKILSCGGFVDFEQFVQMTQGVQEEGLDFYALKPAIQPLKFILPCGLWAANNRWVRGRSFFPRSAAEKRQEEGAIPTIHKNLGWRAPRVGRKQRELVTRLEGFPFEVN